MATYERAIADEASRLVGRPPGATNPTSLGLRLLHESLLKAYLLRPAWADAPHIQAPVIHHLWIPEEEYPNIHFYDVNGAYLSAARNSRIPWGEPESVPNQGVVTTDSVLHMSEIVSPFDGLIGVRSAGWYGSAMGKLVVDTGGTFTPGPLHWQFPAHHYVLRPWAERIWTARTQATSREVNGFLKETAVMTFGCLSRKRKGEPLTWLYQPHWRAEIIGQHTAKMARMVMRWRALGAVVLGVKDDAIALASHQPDALAACPEPEQIGSGLGRLKVQFSLQEQFARNAIRNMPAASSPQTWFDDLRRSHGK